jgi:hypothetical protein
MTELRQEVAKQHDVQASQPYVDANTSNQDDYNHVDVVRLTIQSFVVKHLLLLVLHWQDLYYHLILVRRTTSTYPRSN